jgi:2,3-bisphosphoglycerate-dependent phosphoglycerate mutase
MRLILVRHGETIENRTGISMGHSPGKLTPEGIEQARTLGKHLRGERIDKALCSDLKRAQDTAAEILRGRNIPIQYSSLLRERSLGVFQGRPLEELYKAEEESGGWDTFRPTYGETFGDLRNRAQVFLEQIVGEPVESLLLISHGGFLRMLLGIIMGKDMKESIAISQENACYNIVEHDCSWHVNTINGTDHLSK